MVAYGVSGSNAVRHSLLRECPNVSWFLDEPAASLFTKTSEVTSTHDHDAQRRTLIEYSLRDGKPLSTGQNPLATQVLLDLKQRCDDERFLPREKTVLCLSPHPDDDVICCGATLMKMSGRGNKVVVAYGVSGSNAVRDSLLRKCPNVS